VIGLQATLWLPPAGISVLAFALVYTLLHYVPTLQAEDVSELWWLFSGDASTARDLLATLASAMITMTSLVVSITVVVLTLAANQLGPRLVGNFMSDNQIKAVLGLFIGTILYLIVVLRSLSLDLATSEVPHLAVSVGTAFSILCLFALLLYVHKIVRSIIADTVVRDVSGALRRAIARNLPALEDARSAPDGTSEPTRAPEWWLALGKSGYVQVIDYGALVKLAQREDVVIRVCMRPGHFVLSEGRHMAVLSPRADQLAREIQASVVIGPERSPAQDLEYSMRQLVEIALRALSPGINDPFTAIAAIDHLGAALADALGRSMPEAVHRDNQGRVRVLADVPDFTGLIDAAFNQIWQAGCEHAAVLIELADILGKLAPAARTADQRHAIQQHVAMIERAGAQHLDEPRDAADLAARIEQARRKFEEASEA
jgi:uncharacterized membrane protein